MEPVRTLEDRHIRKITIMNSKYDSLRHATSELGRNFPITQVLDEVKYNYISITGFYFTNQTQDFHERFRRQSGILRPVSQADTDH